MKNSKLLFASLIIGGILLMAMGFTVADEWLVPAKYKTMKNSHASSTDDYGSELYETHCASCHGDEGYGDGKKAESLETEMRELGSEEVQAQTDGELYYKSIIGRDEMPNFEKKIDSDEDRWLVINYLRQLAE
jgi:mono/diheme cytochrome c family protein